MEKGEFEMVNNIDGISTIKNGEIVTLNDGCVIGKVDGKVHSLYGGEEFMKLPRSKQNSCK